MSGNQFMSDDGLRVDGRKPHEQRELACRLGVFTQADGSAYVRQGNTAVLAAVYGPHEVAGGRSKQQHDRCVINCQFSQATFSTPERKRRPRGDMKSNEMTLHLKQTFDAAILSYLYPRCQIDLFVEVLETDGSMLSVAINAATMALIDAGVSLTDYVCSCTACLFNDDVTAIDLNNLEESSRGYGLTVAILPKSEEVVLLEMASSRIHMDHVEKLLEVAIKGCKEVHSAFDKQVKNQVARSIAQKEG